jgi:hypothetical protein
LEIAFVVVFIVFKISLTIRNWKLANHDDLIFFCLAFCQCDRIGRTFATLATFIPIFTQTSNFYTWFVAGISRFQKWFDVDVWAFKLSLMLIFKHILVPKIGQNFIQFPGHTAFCTACIKAPKHSA